MSIGGLVYNQLKSNEVSIEVCVCGQHSFFWVVFKMWSGVVINLIQLLVECSPLEAKHR